jgi:two-component system, response regulator PdtaR
MGDWAMSASAAFSALVVEDEPMIRLDLATYLEQAGYTVHQAGSALEAIEILERDRSIRIVFTDVRMPGDMDGIALARTIRKRWPPTIIVICSGNTEEVRADLSDIQLIRKPYLPDDLLMVVSALEVQLAQKQ